MHTPLQVSNLLFLSFLYIPSSLNLAPLPPSFLRPMPAGLIARVTSNLYKEKAAQLNNTPTSQQSTSPPPSYKLTSPEPVHLYQPQPQQGAAAPYADPYSSHPTLVLPSDPADTLQFQALSIDPPTSPKLSQPAIADQAGKGHQLMHRCV